MKNSSFLDEIEHLTKLRVEKRAMLNSLSTLKELIPHLVHKILPFETLLRIKDRPLIIAEIKKSSPSLGSINQAVDVSNLGRSYYEQGAMAISVLTEPHYFNGDIETIINIRNKDHDLPILQKDFVIDAYQIYEARVIGADCVLLIVALLTEAKIKELLELATDLGLSVLVEVHNEEELAIALKLGSKIIGINNRNLHTLEVSIETSRRMIKQFNSANQLKEDLFLISESGIETSEQITELQDLGFDAFLIGSSLMKTTNPAKKLRSLIEGASK